MSGWPLERVLFALAGSVTLASALLAARPRQPWLLLLTAFVVVNQWLFGGWPRHRARVDRVDWGEDGRVVVRLAEAAVDASYPDELEQAGWHTFPRHDGADDWVEQLGTD